MKAPLLLTTVLIGSLLAGAPAADELETDAKKKPVLAVFNTDTRGTRLERAELDMLSDDLTAGVEKALPGFKVIAPRALKRALVDAMKGRFDECFDKLCQFSLSKEVGADHAMSSSITRVGTRCILTATIWDADKTVSVLTATGKSACERKALLVAVNKVSRALQERLPPIIRKRRQSK